MYEYVSDMEIRGRMEQVYGLDWSTELTKSKKKRVQDCLLSVKLCSHADSCS